MVARTHLIVTLYAQCLSCLDLPNDFGSPASFDHDSFQYPPPPISPPILTVKKVTKPYHYRPTCSEELHSYNIFTTHFTYFNSGPDSSVSIVTDYELDGPGSNPGGDEVFRSSRPALGPHPASRTMGTGSFEGVEAPGAWG